jgi:hypothetical protein
MQASRAKQIPRGTENAWPRSTELHGLLSRIYILSEAEKSSVVRPSDWSDRLVARSIRRHRSGWYLFAEKG